MTLDSLIFTQFGGCGCKCRSYTLFYSLQLIIIDSMRFLLCWLLHLLFYCYFMLCNVIPWRYITRKTGNGEFARVLWALHLHMLCLDVLTTPFSVSSDVHIPS